jgi:hypothetical protein
VGITGGLQTARQDHTATLLPNGNVLVTVGNSTLGSTEIYDPVANTWSAGSSLSVGRATHAATLLHDGTVLVEGGEGFLYAAGILGPLASSERYWFD